MTQDEFDAIADEFGVEHPFEVGKKYGLSRSEQLELMRVHNQKIFDEWATDYAKRVGRPVQEVRAEIVRQRQLTAQHCNEVYRREVGLNQSKEDTMATKKNDQTTINENVNESKEDTTMTENTAAANVNAESKKFNYRESKAAAKAFRIANIDKVTKSRKKAVEVTSCLPGKDASNLTDDPAELALLAKAAAVFGWGNEFCTVNQAAKFFGTLKDPERIGWFISWKPTTPKTGKNAGIEQTFETMVFPKDAFEWGTDSGEPEFDTEKQAVAAARKARRVLKRAKDDAKAADDAAGIKRTTRRRKSTSRKPAEKQVIADAPIPAAAPAKLIHIKLANGVEFDARDAKEAAELKALFE